MLSLQELRKYEWCSFFDTRTNAKIKKTGARVGRYLAISGYDDKWQIYSVFSGLPIIDAWINSLEDAVNISKLILQAYSEYVAILESYPDWDMLCVARLSIPNGQAIYTALCGLSKLNRTASYQDFINLLSAKIQ